MSAKRIASTSRSPARRRCGTFPTARWPAANSAPTWCRLRSAGTSCPTPSFATGPPAAACCSCGWTSPAIEVGDEPASGPDLVDLLPAGHIPPGYLPVLQAYDYAGDEVTLVHADDIRLRRMAVFDVLINNADRKGGHILSGVDGQVYGVDHGVSLHVEDKLRTVLWGWAGKPVDDETLETVARLRDQLRGDARRAAA